MMQRQKQNRAKCAVNKAENWMAQHLAMTGMRWTRQAQWGFRLYDFWNKHLGVAVEVDGAEHDSIADARRDKIDFERSGIVVIRVRNFNEDDAQNASVQIHTQETWNDRRSRIGLKPIKNA